MRALTYIKYLQAQGRYSFNIEEAESALQLKKVPTINALRRLRQNNYIVSPARGFYLIVPPEYQAYGCLPAEVFVPALMNFFKKPYYVGFLSAAQYYGAAHQKPQRFQIVTSKSHRAISCGRVNLEFIINKNTQQIPTKAFNTAAGTISIITPEALAMELVTMPQHAAGLNNVATVLNELIEVIQPNLLLALAKQFPKPYWIQRLGYLLEQLGHQKLADHLHKALKNKKIYWVKLVSQVSYRAITRNPKWKIIINTDLEPDE